VVGVRFCWTDYFPALIDAEVASALTVMGAIPTGRPASTEEVVSLGTTLWDMHTRGDLAFHLGIDKRFGGAVNYRYGFGVDLFYEVFFDRTRDAPAGTLHPLLLNQKPYVGDTYTVNPGDFSGVSLQVDAVPWFGPARATWITGYDLLKAWDLPPIISLSLFYSFVHLQQTDWRSDFPLWDWDREKYWRPGYKNILEGRLTISFLRLGAPLQVYASYRTLTLIPGRNCRAPNILGVGVQVPVKLW